MDKCEDCNKELKYSQVVWVRRDKPIDGDWNKPICADCYGNIYPGRKPSFLSQQRMEPDNVPIVFNIDRLDDTGYGITINKEYGSAYVHLRKSDPYESRVIRLDFHQLCNMVDEIRLAEKKEKNNRVLAGIDD